MFDFFWYFDRLVEDEVLGEAEIAGSHHLLWNFRVRVYVTGMGCGPMGLAHVWAFCNV
jgi:hypothetical protein